MTSTFDEAYQAYLETHEKRVRLKERLDECRRAEKEVEDLLELLSKNWDFLTLRCGRHGFSEKDQYLSFGATDPLEVEKMRLFLEDLKTYRKERRQKVEDRLLETLAPPSSGSRGLTSS